MFKIKIFVHFITMFSKLKSIEPKIKILSLNYNQIKQFFINFILIYNSCIYTDCGRNYIDSVPNFQNIWSPI
jgi:hypothetical protein